MHVDDADGDHVYSKPCDVDSAGNSNADDQAAITHPHPHHLSSPSSTKRRTLATSFGIEIVNVRVSPRPQYCRGGIALPDLRSVAQTLRDMSWGTGDSTRMPGTERDLESKPFLDCYVPPIRTCS